jgi:hypothetical protein
LTKADTQGCDPVFSMCKRSEGRQGAQSVNSYFVLRALAAQEMPHEREISCRRAAGEPDIHADRSEDQRSNSQFAGQTRLLQARLMLTQKNLACAARFIWLCSILRRSGRSYRPILAGFQTDLLLKTTVLRRPVEIAGLS